MNIEIDKDTACDVTVSNKGVSIHFAEANAEECHFEWASKAFSAYSPEAISEVHYLIAQGKHEGHPNPRAYLALAGKGRILKYYKRRNKYIAMDELFCSVEPQLEVFDEMQIIDSLGLTPVEKRVLLDRLDFPGSDAATAERLGLSQSYINEVRQKIKKKFKNRETL